MKKPLRHWAVAAVGAAAAFAFTSCTYDPYYSSAGGSYSSGYGDGYGYGGSHFSTSVFVGPGNPRWGYDPYCYSYYDYHRRCYYDPYLNGYYPMGYRPAVIVGAPHPYGWRPGGGYCPPPRVIRDVTVVNYRNREAAYRGSGYGWARQVRQQPVNQGRVQGQHPGGNSYNKPNTGSHPPYGGNTKHQSQGRSPYSQNVKPAASQQHKGRLPAGYNTPVTASSQRQTKTAQRNGPAFNQTRQAPQQKIQGGNRGGAHPTPPARQGGRQEGTHPAKGDKRDVRKLGQG